jgi:purine-binding chemotaxis protein CheW
VVLTTPSPDRTTVDVALVRLDTERIAFPLHCVLQVLPAVAVSPLPGAPSVVTGVVNLRGMVLPVLDLRARLGHPTGRLDPDHHIVVCRIEDRRIGVWVDHVEGILRLQTADIVDADEIAATRHLKGVVLLSDGVLLVCDMRSFIAADEALRLDTALARVTAGGLP